MGHFLSISQLSGEDIISIFNIAGRFKREGIPKRYSGDWLLAFLEPSTRTRLSFERSLKLLGFETYLLNSEGSSLKKGETLRDTVLTVKAQGFMGVVIRTSENGALETLKDLDIAVINAGDGTNEHPTQALIDGFTLKEVFGEIRGLRILYVGDIAFSRVFRSGYKLFKKLGAEVGVCGPRSLVPADLELLGVRRFFKLEEALNWCDAAIFLRIQKERQNRPLITSESDYLKTFGLTPERASLLRERGKFYLHPGPVNRNVEIASAEVYGKNSLILKQVENGIFVRAAVVKYTIHS
jgi:aspartate carbamoyltransferase catalytic subunit